MKKTLAAVLAAAMALSTATVAFATDHLIDENWTSASTQDLETEIQYGRNTDRYIGDLDDGHLTSEELADRMDDGFISVTAIVTEGSNKLDGKPSISIFKTKGNATQKEETKTVWAYNVYESEKSTKIVYRKGSKVTEIPVFKNGNNWETALNFKDDKAFIDGETSRIKEKTTGFGDVCQDLVGNYYAETKTTLEDDTTGGGDKILRLRFKVADTYGTGDTTVGMKLRVTVKKAFDSEDGTSYRKGDTYTTEEFKFKAKYGEIAGDNDYTSDMQVTLEEVDKRNVKFDASDLYDEIGSDEFTLTFEDTAVFTAKLSASQKDLNLFYDLDEKSDVTSAYPNVDFEFITFRGKPSFVNSGTMTFNAVGGRNTQVYTFDGETLAPLTTTYDSTYGTVSVKGVKTLGTFVVASEVLEVEDDEDNEPVSSAPIVEESSSSQPSTSDERNPSTGAC